MHSVEHWLEEIHRKKQRWTWLFLDLDNTLWDFDANAKEALKELYRRHELHLHCDWHVDAFVALYQDVNAAYWKKYERGEVDKETLRTARFTDTFNQMGIPAALQPANVWQEYLEICPIMTITMPGANAALQRLSERYKIGILTNGFEATQRIKIQSNGFDPYISFMQTSEQLGVAKPSALFFNEALKKARVSAEEVMYLGDTWDTDVLGGCQAGLATFWYQTRNHRALPTGDINLSKSSWIQGGFWVDDMPEFKGESWQLPNYMGRVYDWDGFASWLLA